MVKGRVHYAKSVWLRGAATRIWSNTYDLAFCAMVFFDHLHIRVLGQTTLTNRGEVRGLPSGAVQVMFDLGRHDGGLYPREWTERAWIIKILRRWRLLWLVQSRARVQPTPTQPQAGSRRSRGQTKVATLSAQASGRSSDP